ncbi:restriction endonuclease subunit S [Parasphingopyxis algicola]|uniref:restriction endonuclease subunit S n=1 Tax=Parasphingopyxis algicola TaxID=2026624 RepID=UPI0015A0295C|nr:restriction endonuclease subunit S [Parasphingopyxis algicola]QLC24865.1 restriction endonuclease subunit S [Parasphingopyxis algicola]
MSAIPQIQLGKRRVINGNSIPAKTKAAEFAGVSEGLPYVATKDISFDHRISYDTGVKIPADRVDTFKIAPSGTVLICAEGGSAGRKIGITDRPVAFVNKLYGILPHEDFDPRYVYYYLQGEEFQEEFRSKMTGVIGGVSLTRLRGQSLT